MKIFLTDKEKYKNYPSLNVLFIHFEGVKKEDFIACTENHVKDMLSAYPESTDLPIIFNAIKNEHPISVFELILFSLFMTQTAFAESIAARQQLKSLLSLTTDIISTLGGGKDEKH